MKHTQTFQSGFNRNTPKQNYFGELSKAFLLPIVLLVFFFLLLGNNLIAQCTLACNNQINLSLSSDCAAEITFDMMLQDPYNSNVCSPTGHDVYYVITVMDQSGLNVLPTSPFVTGNEIGQNLSVKVKHWASGNICWGNVLVEDKLGPQLDCPNNITVQCTDATDTSVTGFPTVDDCSEFNINHYDSVQDLGCGDPTEIITRTFIATDAGGYSNSCQQTISVANPDITTVQFPPNLDNIESPALACEVVAGNDNLTEPSNTGFPSINGNPILPGLNGCGLNVGYTDNILESCDGTYKIFRSWSVLEWCTSTIINDMQIIKVADDDAPDLVCQPTITVSTTSSSNCTASILLPAASVSDLCSSIEQVNVYSQFGQTGGNGGLLTNVPIGTHTVTYQAIDACGNMETCQSTVTVSDDDSPTVVCDEFTVVTLNSSGVAFVNAETFDDGSYDNCCLDDFLVRRMQAGCGESATFDEQVKFCCEDIGQSVMVQLQVSDCYGNSNTCMVQATVEENSVPLITCPGSVNLSCTDDYTDLNLTGQPLASDGCGFTAPTYSDIANLNSCDAGTVTRTWFVSDNQGNDNSCQQLITLVDNTPLSVNFPPDYTAGSCTQPEDLDPEDLPTAFAYPTYNNNDCEQPAVNISDQFFEVAPPACFKIIRTWTVIDWCVYDPSIPNSPGYFQGVQNIIVMDNDAPEVTCPDDFTVNTAGNCTAVVQWPQPTVDDCSQNTQTFINSNIGAGFGPFNNVQPGNYTATYTVSDGCGNVASCQTSVTVNENSQPTPYCISGLSIELMPIDEDQDGIPENGFVEIWASDFDAGSFDNCGGEVSLAFSTDINDTNAGFTCADVGANPITMYVIDEDGNFDYCQTTLFVETVPNVCGGEDGPFIIAGAISDENGNMLENAMVSINDGVTEPHMTDENGQYEFEAITAGADYTINPGMPELPTNGVTTYDLVIMRRHILSETLLDSPYKIIAADINNNGSITTADIVELKKIILTDYEDFPSNTSWRFIDAAYEFPNPANPFETGFPEVYNINNLENDMISVDFVAIKIGDVNGTAATNGFTTGGEERSAETLFFRTKNTKLSSGDTYQMPVYLQADSPISSGQLTWAFDAESINIEDIVISENSNFVLSDFSLKSAGQGVITVAWYTETPINYNDVEAQFYINLRAKKDVQLKDVSAINSSKTTAIAYTSKGIATEVELQVIQGQDEVKNEVRLYQNQPNPVADLTIIRFDLPENTKAELQITDLNGRVLFTKNTDFKAGRNEVSISADLFAKSGLYYYRLLTDAGAQTRKMIVL